MKKVKVNFGTLILKILFFFFHSYVHYIQESPKFEKSDFQKMWRVCHIEKIRQTVLHTINRGTRSGSVYAVTAVFFFHGERDNIQRTIDGTVQHR